jgi:hypothetical protein
MGSFDSGLRSVTGSCEDGSELARSITGGNFSTSEQLSAIQKGLFYGVILILNLFYLKYHN